MAGTVRVPSMSKTTPRRRALGVVRLVMWNGRFGCKKRRDLDKDDKGIEYLLFNGYGISVGMGTNGGDSDGGCVEIGFEGHLA
jgi:hypothetical protein